ncbi:MAG: aldehyde dehydrogenase EutE, partial [Eubacterium sp.]
MNIDTTGIEYIVKKVMDQIDYADETGTPVVDGKDGVFQTMDAAIEAAAVAQKEYMKLPLAMRRKMIAAMREIMLKKENMETICAMVVEESEMGNYEHKLLKHQLATTGTPGVEDLVTEAWAGDDGCTLLELSPFGVIGA